MSGMLIIAQQFLCRVDIEPEQRWYYAVALFIGHPGFRFRAESTAATAAEAPDETQGSGGDLTAVFVALLRRRWTLNICRYVEASHEAVQRLRSTVSVSLCSVYDAINRLQTSLLIRYDPACITIWGVNWFARISDVVRVRSNYPAAADTIAIHTSINSWHLHLIPVSCVSWR